MLNPNIFISAEILSENIINEIVMEEDCNDFISFNKDYPHYFKNIFENINKLIFNLDDKLKYKIHKFFTKYINKIHIFKSKTLLPCYVALYYLYNEKKIILNVNMSRYLFKIDIKQNKIDVNFDNINKVLNTNIKYNKFNVEYLIKGWVYIIDNNINLKLLNFIEDIVFRLILLNLKINEYNKELMPIPCHFELYKKIDNYIFIILYYILNYDVNFLNEYKSNINLIYKFLIQNSINKSHYKITYTKYIINTYLHDYVKDKYFEKL
jgi:hypothetical protein